MRTTKGDVPEPEVKSKGDNQQSSPESSTDSSLAMFADTQDEILLGRFDINSTSYGAIDWTNPRMAEFGNFTLYSSDVTGDTMAPETQATVDNGVKDLSRSLRRDAEIQALVTSTEAAAVAGNYDNLAHFMTDAYTRLKDDPEALLDFRNSLRSELKDDHITVDGGQLVGKNGVETFGVLLHKEGSDTALELVASTGEDGLPGVSGRAYDFLSNGTVSDTPAEAAQDLTEPFDAVAAANHALALSKHMPSIKAMDADGNGFVDYKELTAYVPKDLQTQAAHDYMVANFRDIANTTAGPAQIDLKNEAALANFPELQAALKGTKEWLGDRPLTRAYIEQGIKRTKDAISNSLLPQSEAHRIQRQLNQVLANFSTLHKATVDPDSIGISAHDRKIHAGSAAARALAASVFRASDGVSPVAPLSLDSIISATGNPREMSELLPEIVSAVNNALEKTKYRFSLNSSDSAGEDSQRKTLQLSEKWTNRRVYSITGYVAD